MKTRAGFVSNSSSSSFVIVTTKEKWQEATKKLTEKIGDKNLAKIVIGEYGEPEKCKVLGQDAWVFSGIMSTEEYGSDAIYALKRAGKITEDEAEEMAERAYEYMNSIEEILREDGVSYVGGESY